MQAFLTQSRTALPRYRNEPEKRAKAKLVWEKRLLKLPYEAVVTETRQPFQQLPSLLRKLCWIAWERELARIDDAKDRVRPLAASTQPAVQYLHGRGIRT